MQTFLVASSNSIFIESEIKKITGVFNIAPVNLIDISPVTSIGIADVKKITHNLTLKPFGGGERVVIIRDMEKATLEAGNALLKILEEPPENNIIILVTVNINKLLPTIVSRCQIISDNNKTGNKSSDLSKTKIFLKQILNSSAGERIILNQKIASREEAIQLLSDLLLVLEELLRTPDKEIGITLKETAELITKVSTAKYYLERYINFKATLDVLFLGFPKINAGVIS